MKNKAKDWNQTSVWPGREKERNKKIEPLTMSTLMFPSVTPSIRSNDLFRYRTKNVDDVGWRNDMIWWEMKVSFKLNDDQVEIDEKWFIDFSESLSETVVKKTNELKSFDHWQWNTYHLFSKSFIYTCLLMIGPMILITAIEWGRGKEIDWSSLSSQKTNDWFVLRIILFLSTSLSPSLSLCFSHFFFFLLFVEHHPLFFFFVCLV